MNYFNYQDDKLFWILTATASSLAIIFAKSEAAFVAVIATLFLASLFAKKIRRITIPLTIIATLAIALIPSVRVPMMQKLTLQDYSGQVRIAQWHDTIEMFKDKPFFGVGLSGYPIAIKAYHSTPQNEIFQYPHNIFLNVWVELGLLGLAVLGYAGALVIKTFWQTWKKEPIVFLATGVLLEMAIHGLVDVPYLKNDLSVLVWFFFAIIFVTHTTYASHSH